MEVTPIQLGTPTSAVHGITDTGTPATETKVEAIPEAEVKEAAKEDSKEERFAPKFAALARREKQIQQREAKLKELQTRYGEYEKQEQELKRNPLKILKERYNLSYEDLTKLMLNDEKPTPDMIAREARDEVERFRQEQRQRDEQAKEEAKRQVESDYQSQMQTFLGEIQGFVKQNAEKFELAAAFPNSHQIIYNTMVEQYEKQKRVLSVDEAAALVEAQFEKELEPITKLKKIQSKFQTEEPKGANLFIKKEREAPRTLSNSHQTQVPAPSNRPLSVEESKELASKILRWT